jgi:adenylate cyclase
LVLELDPNHDRARDLMIPAYLQLGRYDEAVDGLNRWAARDDGAWMWAYRAVAYSRSGHAEGADRGLAKLEQMSSLRPDRIATLLIAYSGTGQKERALELLQQAYWQHSNAVVQIKVDPMYDPIRSDPRFEDFMRRLGFEH